GPRAGGRGRRRDRAGHRRPRPGRYPLHGADGPAPLPRPDGPGGVAPDREEATGAPAGPPTRGAARPGGGVPEVPREGPGAALPQRRRPRRGPVPLPHGRPVGVTGTPGRRPHASVPTTSPTPRAPSDPSAAGSPSTTRIGAVG